MHGADPLDSFVLRPNYDRALDSVGCRWGRAPLFEVGGRVASKPYLDAALCDVFFCAAVDVTSRASRSILRIEVYRIPCPWS